MTRKTRKNCKKHQKDCLIKKATHIKCMMKSCKAKKYQSVYGSTTGGSIRSERSLFY